MQKNINVREKYSNNENVYPLLNTGRLKALQSCPGDVDDDDDDDDDDEKLGWKSSEWLRE